MNSSESHCLGTFWTEQEIAVIDALAKRQDFSHVAVLRNALRNYQLAVEGTPDVGELAKSQPEDVQLDVEARELAQIAADGVTFLDPELAPPKGLFLCDSCGQAAEESKEQLEHREDCPIGKLLSLLRRVSGRGAQKVSHPGWCPCGNMEHMVPVGTSYEAAPVPATPEPIRLPFQKALTVVMQRDESDKQAEADLASIADGLSTIVRIGIPELYFHHLRLRIAEKPELADKIAIFYLSPEGVFIPIDSTNQLRWPVGFGDEIWCKEKEIQKVKMPHLATTQGTPEGIEKA